MKSVFIKTFKVNKIASLSADREFIGKDWISFLVKQNIPFFIRIKGNRCVDFGIQKVKISKFFEHLKKGEKRILDKKLDGYNLHFAGTKSKTCNCHV